MSRDQKGNKAQGRSHRFMQSTEASRAFKVQKPPSPTRRATGAASISSPPSRKRQLLERATNRLASLSTSKIKSKLPVYSPTQANHTPESSLILSSPTTRFSHLPDPIKKPLESPTDKPLPSLPIATYVSRSPVHRRSLLDATERPLRRSVSPGLVEEWPTLSPIKPSESEQDSHHLAGMSQKVTAIKPSLGESVIDRMRHLKINDEESSKGDPQNFTPRLSNAQKLDEVAVSNDIFLDPRPVPVTTESDTENCKPWENLDRRSSLRDLKVLKTRREPKDTVVSNGNDIEYKRKRPSSYIPQPLFSSPVITPRDSRYVNDLNVQSSLSDSPLRNRGLSDPILKRTNSRTIQLKRVKGRISDYLPLLDEPGQHDGQSSQPHPPDVFDSNLKVETQSSNLPLQDANDQERKVSDSSSNDTIKPETHASMETGQDEVHFSTQTPPKQENHWRHVIYEESSPDEEMSPIRSFRFPIVIDDEDDNHSQMTRITSKSSISKAGTIYAQDDHGGYRLKPVSKADPKRGPHVRIQDSADELLLTEEQLAEVEAKRAAYLQKYSSSLTNGNGSTVKVIPELGHLSSSVSGQVNNREEASGTQSQDLSGVRSSRAYRGHLAPPVPAVIPSLTHSPTGWPLEVSKIAPFAEIEPSLIANRSDGPGPATDTCLQDRPRTPVPGLLSFEESPPSSAYTLRTALHNLPAKAAARHAARAQAKSQKSMPDMSSKLLFPPRTSSVIAAKRMSKSASAQLREKTSGILRSYVNQRAAHKSSHKGEEATCETKDDHAHAHPEAVKHANGDTPISPKYMQSYKSSARQFQTNQELKSDGPSSPLEIPENKPKKIKSKISGLFHKSSKEDLLVRSSSMSSGSHNPRVKSYGKESTAHTSKLASTKSYISSPLASSPTLPSPLSATEIYHGTTKQHKPDTPSRTNTYGTTKRKFPRLNHTKTAAKGINAKTPKPEPEPHSSAAFQTSALEASEIQTATTLAFTLLDRARDLKYANIKPASTSSSTTTTPIKPLPSSSAGSTGTPLIHSPTQPTTTTTTAVSPQSSLVTQETLISLSQTLISLITLSRNTEKAREEACAAAIKAEMECVKVRQMLGDVVGMVRGSLGGSGE